MDIGASKLANSPRPSSLPGFPEPARVDKVPELSNFKILWLVVEKYQLPDSS